MTGGTWQAVMAILRHLEALSSTTAPKENLNLTLEEMIAEFSRLGQPPKGHISSRAANSVMVCSCEDRGTYVVPNPTCPIHQTLTVSSTAGQTETSEPSSVATTGTVETLSELPPVSHPLALELYRLTGVISDSSKSMSFTKEELAGMSFACSMLQRMFKSLIPSGETRDGDLGPVSHDSTNPVAFMAWVAQCPECQNVVMVDFCSGAPLLACYNHDEPYLGHAEIPSEPVAGSNSSKAYFYKVSQ